MIRVVSAAKFNAAVDRVIADVLPPEFRLHKATIQQLSVALASLDGAARIVAALGDEFRDNAAVSEALGRLAVRAEALSHRLEAETVRAGAARKPDAPRVKP